VKNNIFIYIGIFLFVFSSTLYTQDSESADYRIGPKDILEISVFGLDELNRTVRVSEEGKITLPLLGEVEVQGLTAAQVENKLGEFLEKDYLQDPQVTVFIREHLSKIVYVDGAVRSPGTYELIGQQRLMHIITKAGGLSAEAGDDINVIRTYPDGTTDTLRISIDELYLDGDADLNIPLEPNDSVHVPIDKVINVYVMGEVRSPGALEVKRSNIPTLLQAISQAGGFAERASKGGVKIKRVDENGKEIIIKVNVKDIEKGKKDDIQLKENDVVIVPESFF